MFQINRKHQEISKSSFTPFNHRPLYLTLFVESSLRRQMQVLLRKEYLVRKESSIIRALMKSRAFFMQILTYISYAQCKQ
ncbi:CLUMA_CG020502, isoform A [Clunio marinus]|uniref:CLUMA_CG020502, isoform A n=1 Tax=Clunio marinus TaxID=568069 RepID=A0A1J1J956_9DIPT|nr:CLUMA_CG020502, isoform A [Clunio marinus]